MKKRLVIKLLSLKTINRILFATFLVTLFSQVILADDRIDVKNELKERLDNIVSIVKNKELDDENKMKRVEDIIKPIFDFQLMSALALGRASWTAMTKEDQDRFTDLFTKMLKQSYLSKILNYFNDDITIEEPVQDGKKVHIPTVSKDKKVTVLYKFYQSNTDWKIYDVEFEGISLIQTYRSQFKESLEEKTVKELMAKMEKLNTSN